MSRFLAKVTAVATSVASTAAMLIGFGDEAPTTDLREASSYLCLQCKHTNVSQREVLRHIKKEHPECIQKKTIAQTVAGKEDRRQAQGSSPFIERQCHVSNRQQWMGNSGHYCRPLGP